MKATNGMAKEIINSIKAGQSFVYDETEFAFHPACLALPRLSNENFGALVEDIKTHGQQVPVRAMRTDGGLVQIVDGRHRFLACIEAGREPVVVADVAEDEVYELVRREGFARRRMTTTQASLAAARLRAAAPGRKISASQAAKLFGISRSSITRAIKVESHGCLDLIAAVDSEGDDRLSLQDAVDFIDNAGDKEKQEATINMCKEMGLSVADGVRAYVRDAMAAKEPVKSDDEVDVDDVFPGGDDDEGDGGSSEAAPVDDEDVLETRLHRSIRKATEMVEQAANDLETLVALKSGGPVSGRSKTGRERDAIVKILSHCLSDLNQSEEGIEKLLTNMESE